jgi:O-Antigen ligase
VGGGRSSGGGGGFLEFPIPSLGSIHSIRSARSTASCNGIEHSTKSAGYFVVQVDPFRGTVGGADPGIRTGGDATVDDSMSDGDVRAEGNGGRSLREKLDALLHKSACVLLAMSIVLAPSFYGSTRIWTMRWLAGVLTLVTLCGLGSSWCGRRLRAVPSRAGTAVVFLLVAGWLVTLSGPVLAPDPFGAGHFAELSARWPGSFVARAQTEAMWLISGLFGVFLALVDPATAGLSRMRFYRLMAITGSAVGTLGIVQAMTGSQGPFWSREETPVASAYFATFFEESVGVAFVSLVWPMAAGGLMGRIGDSEGEAKPLFGAIVPWAGMVVAGWLALAVIGSLSGLLIGGALVILLGIWLLWRVPSMRLRVYGIQCGGVAGLCAVVSTMGALVVGKSPDFHSHWTRLQSTLVAERTRAAEQAPASFGVRADGLILSEDNPSDPNFSKAQRQKLMVASWKMIPQSGLLGFGPGSWRQSFPHFTDDALLRSHYLPMQFAHHDYLQGLVEWGVLGTIAWSVLFLGGIWAGVYRLRRYRSKGGRIGEKEGMIAGALAGLCGVLACAWWSFPLQVPAIQLYVAVTLGLLWSAGERRGWSRGEQPQDVIPKPGAT